MNLASNWTATQIIEPNVAFEVSLASGPSGLFLLYEHGSPGNEQLVARKFTGSGWTAASPVSEVGSLLFPAFSQDAAGRLHAVYVNNNGDFLQWRTSTNGVNWSAPVTINVSGNIFPRTNVAAAPATGRGSPRGTRASAPTGRSASCERCRSSAGTSRRTPPSRSPVA